MSIIVMVMLFSMAVKPADLKIVVQLYRRRHTVRELVHVHYWFEAVGYAGRSLGIPLRGVFEVMYGRIGFMVKGAGGTRGLKS